MKTAGIIAEYNPFHKGHQYQLEYTKEILGADYIIIVMSGDYVQRGTPALLSKHTRTEMALRCGADLVLELPVSFSTASAEFFAAGGAEMLHKLGVTDMLCFGSEAGETDTLNNIAEVLLAEPEEYKENLRRLLGQGLSFPAARSQALLKYFESCHITSPGLSALLASPNNILGIEYCKALKRLNSHITPVTVKRLGGGYHEEDIFAEQFSSATAIRRLTEQYSSDAKDRASLISLIQTQVPSEVSQLLAKKLEEKAFVTEEDFSLLLSYCLFRETADGLTRFLDISPNLAQRIMNQRNQCVSFRQFTALLKTKEITQTRIQRGLLHMVLGITHVPASVPYARVLGFRRSAGPLLKEIKQKSAIPLLTKLADASSVLDRKSLEELELNTFASNMYESVLASRTENAFTHEYQKQLVIL